jgi:hypothetical protein
VKTRVKTTLVQIGIPLVVLFSAILLFRIGPFIGWHLVHGFHVEVGQVRLKVPLFYRVVGDSPKTSVKLARFPGFSKGGAISVAFADPNPEPLPPQSSTTGPKLEINVVVEFSETSERRFTLAGHSGVCTESSSVIEHRVFPRADYKLLLIQCEFEKGVEVSFMGSPDSAEEFYDIMQSAQIVGEKH